MKKIKILRNALMLSQKEVGDYVGLSQKTVCENELGIWDNNLEKLEIALSNPSPFLLRYLIRLAKLQHLAKGQNQADFAEKAGLTQGAASLFLRSRRKISDERWESILGNLKVPEPSDSPEFLARSLEIFNSHRSDEGYQLQRRLEELRLSPSELAEGLGVARSTITHYFACSKFTKEVRESIERWFAEVV